jgi:hypothetical protein
MFWLLLLRLPKDDGTFLHVLGASWLSEKDQALGDNLLFFLLIKPKAHRQYRWSGTLLSDYQKMKPPQLMFVALLASKMDLGRTHDSVLSFLVNTRL